MLLADTKEKVLTHLQKKEMLGKNVCIKAKVLSAEEAIGNPERDDFPLLKGRERIVEADFEGARGHAFTDMYGGFQGTLEELFNMPLNNNYRRALTVATINALSKYWGFIDNAVHCKDGQPEQCALQSVAFIKKAYKNIRNITFVGYQPSLIEAFSKEYSLKVLDLDEDNIGEERFGAVILDGQKDMEKAFLNADLILATGSTLVNGTIDGIIECAGDAGKVIFYGVSIAGAAYWMNFKRICFM